MNMKRFMLCALCALGMYAPTLVGMAPAEIGSFKSAFDVQKAIFSNAAKSFDERIGAVDRALNVVIDQLLPKAAGTSFTLFRGVDFEGLTIESAGKNVLKFVQELIKRLNAKRNELGAQKTAALLRATSEHVARETTERVTREKEAEKAAAKDAEVVAARAAAAAPLQAQITRLSSELVAAQAAEQAEKVVAEKTLFAAQAAKEAAEKARDDARAALAIAESKVRMWTANSNSLVIALESLLANLSRGLIQPSLGVLNFKTGGARTVIKAVNEAVGNLKLVKPSYSGPNWK